MSIVWISKRRYTHKDAMTDAFGRVYELPSAWARAGIPTSVELLDYYGTEGAERVEGELKLRSTPLRAPWRLDGLRRRIRSTKPEVIVASGDCFVGLLAWKFARECGSRFVFDVYDDYRKFGAYRLFARFQAYEFLVARASLVLYASKALAARHPSNSPWALVPNGIDPAKFHPTDAAQARAALGLADEGTKWVGYFGGMEPERGPDDLADAVGRLHAADPSIRLLLCGPPLIRPEVEKWVEHLGNVPHSLIPDCINACDVVALPYRRGPIIDMASSCKIAEYLFCRKAVVATRTPNLLDNFPEQAAQLGKGLCEPGDPIDMARAIMAQLREPVIATPPYAHTWQNIADRTAQILFAPG